MSFDVPILIITWSRPHFTQRLLGTLRAIKASQIYVFCDGPPTAPIELKQAVQHNQSLVLNSIDWNSNVSYNLQSTNLGCRTGVNTALSWFFSQVPEGIILEDDCLPSNDFFHFCADLLNMYRDDLRVWTISGNNFLPPRLVSDYSYYFSKYNHCWGWATWSNRWLHHDISMTLWQHVDLSILLSIFKNSTEVLYWMSIWDTLYRTGQPNTWDYQFMLTILLNNGLNILPSHNLVTNVGFSSESTHNFDRSFDFEHKKLEFPLSHPLLILPNSLNDRYTFNHIYLPPVNPVRLLGRHISSGLRLLINYRLRPIVSRLLRFI